MLLQQIVHDLRLFLGLFVDKDLGLVGVECVWVDSCEVKRHLDRLRVELGKQLRELKMPVEAHCVHTLVGLEELISVSVEPVHQLAAGRVHRLFLLGSGQGGPAGQALSGRENRPVFVQLFSLFGRKRVGNGRRGHRDLIEQQCLVGKRFGQGGPHKVLSCWTLVVD